MERSLTHIALFAALIASTLPAAVQSTSSVTNTFQKKVGVLEEGSQ